MKQANAVEARISLDLRVGAAFTRLMTGGLRAAMRELDGKLISYGEYKWGTNVCSKR